MKPERIHHSLRHLIPIAPAVLAMLLLGGCDTSPPTTPPESAEELSTSVETAIEQINPAAMIQAIETQPDAFSADCVVVTKTEHGTLSRQLEMQPGSRVIGRGDQSITRFQGARNAGELVWIDPQGVLRRHTVDEGKVGFWHEPHRSLEVWYVRHGNRDPRWDHQVVAALAIQEQDPALAGELWTAAHAKGYPLDHLSCLSQMLIATMLGNAEEANVLANAYGPLDQTPEGLPVWETDWQQVAAITGDPHWLEIAADYYEEKFPNHKLVNFHGDLTSMLLMAADDAGKPAEPPSVLADSMSRKSILKDMDYGAPWCATSRAVSPKLMEMYAAATEAHDAGEETFDAIRIAQSRDFMHKGWNGPKEKARDIDMTIRFRVKPLRGSQPSQYLREFHIGLANHDMHGGANGAQVPPSARILSLCFSYHTSDDLGLSWLNCSVPSRETWTKLMLRDQAFVIGATPVPDMPDKRPQPGDLHTLRVVRVGGYAEAILDDKRIALVPVPPHLDYPGTHWFVSGTEVEISGYTLDALY